MHIDLRSDTVTKPTPGMLQAIVDAKVGDDVYKEDPTVNELERRVAEMFGLDEGLFFPTGSMANQAAVKLLTNPGDQLICDKWAHVYNYEGGGAAFNSGVSCKLIDGNRGMINAQQVLEAINPPDFYHSPLSRLVCIENTSLKGGGACYDIEEIKKIKSICDTHGLSMHLDGARIMNALVAKDEKPEDYGRLFDTVSICLSKGLGTPLGTVLVGKKEHMKNAIRIRKILGGGMRQIGFMAAAGLYALDNHVERLEDDHRRARELAAALDNMEAVLEVVTPETNIILFYLNDDEDESAFIDSLEEKGVKIGSMGHGTLRIVTHLDYTQEMHERFLRIIDEK